MKACRYSLVAVLTVAVVLAGILSAQLFREPSGDEASPEDLAERAYALLEQDPAAYLPETQSAIRAAAVAVENGGFSTPRGWYLLGLQYRREENFNRSEGLFKRAIALDPEWSLPWTALGILLGQHTFGREEEAKEALHTAIELNPEDGRPCNMLAVMLRLEGNYEEAEQWGRRALELNPEDIAMHNNFANLMTTIGNDAEAEKHYLIATELNPDHPKPWYNLACLCSLQGRLDEAVAFLKEAVTRAPNLGREAVRDPDLAALYDDPDFLRLIYGPDAVMESPQEEPDTAPEAPADAEEKQPQPPEPAE